MEYRKYSDKLYIRLDKGDEILTSLAEICKKENVTTASVQGIGGCGSAVVGVFDPDSKSYHRQQVSAVLELISLDGNVTVLDDAPYLHLHASFAYHSKDGEEKILAGHLLEATIALTGEIILTPADGCITRRYDDALGIRVWDFGAEN